MAIMRERGSEHNLQILMRKCRHFSGVQEKVCKAGVNYDDVVPIPCIGRDDAEVKQAVCKTGTLHYSVAGYNGHLWGQCSTQGCVAWMQ